MPSLSLLAAWCVGAYLLGSIPFGILVTRIFAKRDVREVGSGNIGATNVVRAAGKVAGALTLILDAAKAALPAYFGLRCFGPLGGPLGGALLGGAAFAGHVLPLYLRFRGGKGVATGLGVFAVLAPLAALVGLLVYALVLATVRISAVGSLAALLALGITLAFIVPAPAPVLYLYSFVATVVVLRHQENLKQLFG